MTRRRSYRLSMTLLVFALLGVYLAGNGRVPLFDRDEPRYAVTSRAMLESGDWVVPRFLGEVRTAKPPAVYWLQAAAMRVFGTGEFPVRLPGALACAATVGLMALMLPPLVGRRRAGWACFSLGTSLLVLGVAKVGVTDGPLLLCAAAMQIALLRLLLRRGGDMANALLLWSAVGVGGLVKGPVILGVLLTTLLAWTFFEWSVRRAHGASLFVRTHPLLGLAIILLVCGPWVVLVSLREPSFLSTALGHDVAERSVRGLEGHGQPPGFHLVTLFATWFPWSLLLPAVLIEAWRRRRQPLVRFTLASSVGPWIMFELVVTKLPHYLLVIFPMLAVLSADWIVRAQRGRLRVGRAGARAAAVISAVVALPLAIAPWSLGAPSLWFTVLAGAWGMALAATWWRGRLQTALVTAGCGTAILTAGAYLGWLGRVPALTVSQRVAAALDDAGASSALMVHYKEPSLAWYAGERGITVREADEPLLATANSFAVSTRRGLEQLPAAVQGRWRVIEAIPARNYNKSLERTDVLVLLPQAKSAPPPPTD